MKSEIWWQKEGERQKYISREYKGWEKSMFNMAIYYKVPYISDWSIFKNHSVDCMANSIFQSFPQTHTHTTNSYQSCKNVHVKQYNLIFSTSILHGWKQNPPNESINKITLDEEIVMTSGLQFHILNAKPYPFLCKTSFQSTCLDHLLPLMTPCLAFSFSFLSQFYPLFSLPTEYSEIHSL